MFQNKKTFLVFIDIYNYETKTKIQILWIPPHNQVVITPLLPHVILWPGHTLWEVIGNPQEGEFPVLRSSCHSIGVKSFPFTLLFCHIFLCFSLFFKNIFNLYFLTWHIINILLVYMERDWTQRITGLPGYVGTRKKESRLSLQERLPEQHTSTCLKGTLSNMKGNLKNQ